MEKALKSHTIWLLLAKYTLVVLCGTKLYIHNFGVVLGTNVFNALLFPSTVYGKILFKKSAVIT